MKRVFFAVYVVAGAGWLAGCAHWPKGTPPGQDAEANAIAQELAHLRGVQARPLAVELLDEPTFRDKVRKQADTADRKEIAQEQQAWRAFGLIPPNTDLATLLHDVLVEQIAAYYDEKRHVLVVPRSQQPGTLFDERQVIAHEVEHALQDQRFGFPHFDQLDEDRSLAARALYESDGVLAMVVDAAIVRKLPLPETIARFSVALQKLPPAALASLSGGASGRLEQAPTRLKQLMVFPYLGALPLIVELYRAGGFPLVDQLFRHPPESSEQLLHPDKYRAGEAPIDIDRPHTPWGWHKVGDGVFGELGVRALLSTCLPDQRADAAAAGWGGDHYLIVRGPSSVPGLLWSTAWDDDTHAADFAAAMNEVKACWSHSEPALAEGLTIERQGNRVAISRGPRVEAQRLYALVHPTRPTVPPLGAVAVAPRLEVIDIPPARLEDNGNATIYVDDWLGMETELPPGFEANVEQPNLRLAMRGPAGVVLVSTLESAYNAKSADQFLASTAAAMKRALPDGASLAPDETIEPEVDLGWAHGIRRGWRTDGSARAVRAIVVPLCGGRRALGVVFAGGNDALEAVTAWMRGFSFRTGVHPACL